MGRLLKFTAAVAVVILAVVGRTARGFQCYCNQFYDSSCVEEQSFTCPGEGGACEISIQIDPNGDNYTTQGCVEDIIFILTCEEELVTRVDTNVPYRYCCKEPLCNSEEVIHQLIAGSKLSSTGVTSSSNEASTSNFNPTGTSQTMIASTASSVSSAAAVGLKSREESSIRYEVSTSGVSGISTTSSLVLPTTTLTTANPTTVPTMGTQGSVGLSCVCNAGYSESCTMEPFCTISGDFAHCVIEIVKSTMEPIYQGCSDLITNYFSCSEEVVEIGNNRLSFCCHTDNCNTIEAVLAQPYTQSTSLVLPTTSSLVLPTTSALVLPTTTLTTANPTTAATMGTQGSVGLSCLCNVGYSQSCAVESFCTISGGFAHCLIEIDKSTMEPVFQGCSNLIATYLQCSEEVVEVGNNRLSFCCRTDNCNTIEAILTQPYTLSTSLVLPTISSLVLPTTSSLVLPTTSSLVLPTTTLTAANPTTAATTGTQGPVGLSCVCNVGYSQSCAIESFCTVSGKFAHCVTEIDMSTMELLFQGCSDLVTTYLSCSEQGTETGSNRLSFCCRTDNCNTMEAILAILYPLSSSASSLSTALPPLYPVESMSAMTSLDPSASSTAVDNLLTPPDYAIALISILAFILLVFIIIIVVVTMLHFFPRHVVGIAIPTESDGTPTISTESVDFSNDHLQDMIGTTSGSGSGMPLLIQRSIATQVTLEHLIGKGKFGEVWKASYKGDDIAVKIFHTREEASWFHEVDIYSTCLIRHPNIVRFVAADNKDIGMATQLWLITEYCSNGSLYELLLVEALDEATMLKLLHTAVSGLAHLHQEITGTEGKPAIAHRDIKSRNILVKADYTCCIADLGLAIRYNKTTDTVEEPPTKRVGTRRYLSPEILNDTINVHNFDCFKRSDMYSFGLVMWETARRGECAGHVEEYQLPYFDLVQSDPSFEDMKKVVVDDNRRPGIPNRWHQSEFFHCLSKIIEQCWHLNGEARVTALRVKKNLHNLHSMLGKNKMSSMAKLSNASLSKIAPAPAPK